MDLYTEYPIRCKSCGEQIACFVKEYEQLKSTGLTTEEALNSLGIINWCSRVAFMNPTYVTFNMENRDAIDGIVPVSEVEFADTNKPTKNMFFSSCLEKSYTGFQTTTLPQPTKVGGSSLARKTGIAGSVKSSQSIVAPLATEFGGGVELDIKETDDFKEPEMTGVPTINSDPTFPEQLINVGADKQTVVLNGRTYLAR